MDEGFALPRDSALVSPSPRSFFRSFLNGGLGPKLISDFPVESLNMRPSAEIAGNLFDLEGFAQITGENDVGNELSSKRCGFDVAKQSSRSGIVERIAARTGLDAPKINTARVKFAHPNSPRLESPSSYLTIPAGLSPAALLDSPIFFLNSVTQPSPTTGKLPVGQILCCNDNEVQFNSVHAGNLFTFKSSIEPNVSYTQTAGHEASQIQELSAQIEQQSQGCSVNANVQYPPHDVQIDIEEQKMELSSVSLCRPVEDGYNWRKYGQKHVRGSEFPRSYYKCAHPDCSAKKKIERSQESQATDVVYKGTHNHPKPSSTNPRTMLLPSQEPMNIVENHSQLNGSDMWSTPMQSEATGVSDGTEASSYIPQAQMGLCSEPHGPFEEQEVNQTNCGNELTVDDGNESEFGPKRRKLDTSLLDMNPTSRNIREPRIVVQTTSEVDVLDDGYRWRKYGQKVVKGNPNPRSYYKCTSGGCNVRKHVERASHDLNAVITTYEGRHNHDVPVAKSTSTHTTPASSSFQPHCISKVQEPHQANGSHCQFNVQPSLGVFQPREGPNREVPEGFFMGQAQLGLRNNVMMMPGLGPAVTVNLAPQMHVNLGEENLEHGRFLIPRGDMKTQQITDMGIQIPQLYQQMMGSLPLGS